MICCCYNTSLCSIWFAGYENLVLEDLCWHWEWGFSKELLVHNKSLSKTQYWNNLMKAFEKAGVTSYGISPSRYVI